MRRFFWRNISLSTEIAVSKGLLWRQTSARITLIDPVAFFVALVSAPLLVGLLGVWLLIPPFAVIFGGPLYLIFVTPALWLALQRGIKTPGKFALIGFLVMLGLLALGFVVDAAFSIFLGVELLTFYGGFGLIFAPIWSATFAALYQKFRNKNYPLTA